MILETDDWIYPNCGPHSAELLALLSFLGMTAVTLARYGSPTAADPYLRSSRSTRVVPSRRRRSAISSWVINPVFDRVTETGDRPGRRSTVGVTITSLQFFDAGVCALN
ncbi:MAG: hypothetical protein R2834_04375 [Rhodothermales bacterium]